jgi:hypothetical protein
VELKVMGFDLTNFIHNSVNGSRQTTDVTAGFALHFQTAKQSGRCSSPPMMLQADGKGYGARQASPTQNHRPRSPARWVGVVICGISIERPDTVIVVRARQ